MENYRLSSYSIITELIEDTKKTALVHGYTGAIDIVDRELANYLKINRKKMSKVSFPYENEIWDRLSSRGYITNKNKEKETELVKWMADIYHKKNKLLDQHFTLLISYDCNFRCPYCYEGKISNDGKAWSKKVITTELVDNAFRAIKELRNSEKPQNKKILLYGGEPLLKENKEIVKYVIEKGVEDGFQFAAITNGYEIHEFEEFLRNDKLQYLQITVDGWKDEHNKKRRHYKHPETFDRIVSNIELALSKGVAISVRVNTDAYNIISLNKLKNHFRELGFFNYKSFTLYPALLIDYLHGHESESPVLSEVNYMEIEDYNKKIFEEYKDLVFEDYGVSKKLYDSMTTGKRLELVPIYCSAQNGSYIFDPLGKIYSCLESVGIPTFAIGDYSIYPYSFNEMKNEWHSRNSGTIKECSQCRFTFLCRGGCTTQVLRRGKWFNTPYCNGFSTTFALAINKSYKDFKNNTNSHNG